MTKWIVPVGALLVIAAVAIVVARRTPAVPAKTAPAAIRLPSEADLSGPVQPRTITGVAPSQEGILDSWAVEIGEPVIKDQLLAKIRVAKVDTAAQQAQSDLDQMQSRAQDLESSQIAAKLEISRAEAEQSRARADVERLKKLYTRYQALWDAGALPRLTFEKTQKDYKDAKDAAGFADDAAKAAKDRADSIAKELEATHHDIEEKKHALDQANADLASGDLHSPADGIVIARHGDPGQPVNPAMKDVVQIATDLTQLQVTLTPSPEDLSRMRAGESAAVEFGGEEISGKVREIQGQEVIVDFMTSVPVTKLGGTAQVKIKF